MPAARLRPPDRGGTAPTRAPLRRIIAPPLLPLLMLLPPLLLLLLGLATRADAACTNCAATMNKAGTMCALNVPFPATTLTVAFWSYPRTAASATEAQVSAASAAKDNLFLYYASDSSTSVYLNGGSTAMTYPTVSYAWTHIVVTWRSAGGQLRVYQNGTLVGSANAFGNGISLATTVALCIGGDQDSYGGGFQTAQGFDGMIDDLAVFNDAMSQSAVTTLFTSGVSMSDSTLLYVTRFDACGESSAVGVMSEGTSRFRMKLVTGTVSFVPSLYPYATVSAISPTYFSLASPATPLLVLGTRFDVMSYLSNTVTLTVGGVSATYSGSASNSTMLVFQLPAASSVPALAPGVGPVTIAAPLGLGTTMCNITLNLYYGAVITGFQPQPARVAFGGNITVTILGQFASSDALAATQVLFVSYAASRINATVLSRNATQVVAFVQPAQQAADVGVTEAALFGTSRAASTAIAYLNVTVVTSAYGNATSAAGTWLELTPSTPAVFEVAWPRACYVGVACDLVLLGRGLATPLSRLLIGGVDVLGAVSSAVAASNGTWLALRVDVSAVPLGVLALELNVSGMATGAAVASALTVFDCSSPANSSYNASVSLERCSCAPGWRFNVSTGACDQCAVGSFSSTWNVTQCPACSVGTFASGIGATACGVCAAGSYAFGSGATVCSALGCVLGQYALAGASVCLNCSTGTFGNTTGISACTDCSAGSFAATNMSTHCSLCAAGSFSNGSRSSACSACASGSFSAASGATSCTVCSAGSSANATGASSCDACALGMISTVSGASACSACEAGAHAATTGLSVCSNCSAGSFSNATGASVCESCPVGSVSSGAGSTTCAACVAGTFSAGTGFSLCSNCSAGSFSNATGASVCESCPVGSVLGSAGGTACTQCSAGTFSNASLSSCVDCSAGSFSNATGASFCFLCATGSAVGAPGATVCALCIAGAFGSALGLSVCSNCSAGSISSALGASACSACSSGTFADSGGLSTCSSCAAGTFANATGLSMCASCALGRFSNATGTTVCSLCVAGGFSNVTGASVCVDCSLGQFSHASGASACDVCAAGSSSSSLGSTLCQACSPGSFAAASSASACSPCSAGSYASVDGLTSCLSCDAGSFSNATAATLCFNCSIGWAQPSSGASSCSECAPGSFSSAARASVCTACARGTFASSNASSACLDCAVGQDSVAAASACSDCLSGAYANVSGTSQCAGCEPGSFSAAPAATACSLCPTNWYTPAYGRTTCTKCPAGFYTSSSGSSYCQSPLFTVTSISPRTCTQALCTIVVVGQGLYNDTIIQLGSSQFLARDNCSVVRSDRIECELHRVPDVSYVNVSVINGDADRISFFEPLYLTDDCPTEGEFGRGVDCVPCPEGGVCPGGYRIWPQPGWWNSGETSGAVQRCTYPTACLGGRFSVCREGHTGYLCGECIHHYYLSSGVCRECSNPSARSVLLFVLATCMSALVLACTFASDSIIGTVEFSIFCLQVLWATTATAGAYLPEPLQSVLTQFSLFAGDISFVQPDCFDPQGLQGFSLLFFVNISLLAGSLLPFFGVCALGVYLRLLVIRWRARRRRTPIPAEFDAWYRLEAKDRILRGVIVLTAFGYFNLNLLTWNALNCRPDSAGVYRLAVAPLIVCFEDVHRYMAPVAVVVQLALLFVPLFAFTFLFRIRARVSRLVPQRTFASRVRRMIHLLRQMSDSDAQQVMEAVTTAASTHTAAPSSPVGRDADEPGVSYATNRRRSSFESSHLDTWAAARRRSSAAPSASPAAASTAALSFAMMRPRKRPLGIGPAPSTVPLYPSEMPVSASAFELDDAESEASGDSRSPEPRMRRTTSHPNRTAARLPRGRASPESGGSGGGDADSAVRLPLRSRLRHRARTGSATSPPATPIGMGLHDAAAAARRQALAAQPSWPLAVESVEEEEPAAVPTSTTLPNRITSPASSSPNSHASGFSMRRHPLLDSAFDAHDSDASPSSKRSAPVSPLPAGAAPLLVLPDSAAEVNDDADDGDASEFGTLGRVGRRVRSSSQTGLLEADRLGSGSESPRSQLSAIVQRARTLSMGSAASQKALEDALRHVQSNGDMSRTAREHAEHDAAHAAVERLPVSSKLVFEYFTGDYRMRAFWFGALNFVLDWSFAIGSVFLGPYTLILFIYNVAVLTIVLGILLGLKPFAQQVRNFAYFILIIVSMIGALVSFLADPTYLGSGVVLTALSYIVLIFLVLFFLALVGMYANLIPPLKRRLKPIATPACCKACAAALSCRRRRRFARLRAEDGATAIPLAAANMVSRVLLRTLAGSVGATAVASDEQLLADAADGDAPQDEAAEVDPRASV